MKLNVNIIESDKQIKDSILKSIKETVARVVSKAMPQINTSVKSIIKNALVAEPEYGSLLSGTLKAEFGIPNSSVVDSVVDALVNTLNIEASPITISRNGIAGGFSLTMMKSDDMNGLVYADLASVNDAKGYSLPWLEWLLYEKNNPIVKRYNVSYTDSPYSRSGMAIMVPSASNWRVPPMYAGSITNNWTTRAISRTEKEIYKTIISNIEAKL